LDCAALTFQLEGNTLSFSEYAVISFGGFSAATGDTEGRVAARDNFVAGSGFSVGALITDNSVPYSLIVGGNATWGSGALYPASAGAWIGGDFSAPAYLAALKTNADCATPGCMDSIFDGAKACYDGVSQSWAAQPSTASISSLWGTATVTCNNPTDTRYYLNIDSSSFNMITFWQLMNCNTDAQYVMTIGGTGDVQFIGSPFPTVTGGVTYNVPGQRNVIVTVGVNGSLLAVDSTHVSVTGGVVVGKLVAGEIGNLLQVNLPCSS
jgi:choice-of-anchor A domain-containing protein